ncbi:ABC transporter permease subunit [Amycolatopsis alba]|uniref:ABC transporter permease n=1 Tax=Amycolatopsis alba DSM 44262 TaxID=1125972 RepID=A0A229RYW2_AMYAL|nr:ABC transporter permease subunit [Amycolatopsis alba]OXM51701.1 ABC transporter permease [Amycolatopsis alba DSM 44262]
MLWLTWRQHRTQLLVTLGFLATLGAILFLSGQAAIDASNGKTAMYCHGGGIPCREYDAGLEDLYQQIYPLIAMMPFVPLLAGVFWGAPLLAKEYERNTHQLAWTQSVGRGHWLAVKFGVLAGCAVLAGFGSGQMFGRWLEMFPGKAETFAETSYFGAVGVAPAAWWLFAFALGTAAGVLVRKTLPAIAITVAVFLAASITLLLLRPHYAEPVRTTGSDPATLGALIVKVGRVAPDGHDLGSLDEVPGCPLGLGKNACAEAAGYRDFTVYQPIGRFWRFQWTEAGILLAATVVLGGVAAGGTVRRRR